MKLDPIISSDKLQFVVEQLNRRLQQLNQYAGNNDTDISDLQSVTKDQILNTATIAQVTSDYDLTYSDSGEITVDG